MGKIFAKELKGYFHSFFGWLFLAVFTAFCSMFIVYINLMNGVPYISRTISSMVVILMFVFPLLTMRTLAAEKRNRTDQLLLTSPIKVSSIILGKFFSLVAMLCIACLILVVGIFVIAHYGEITFGDSVLSVFALILFGSMLASIGVFMSSLTEHQIIAAVLTYGAYIFFWFIPQLLSSVFSANAFIVNAVKVIDVLSPFDRMFSGILNAKDVFYVLSVIAIFLILSARVFGKSSLSVSLVGMKKFWFSTLGIIALFAIIVAANIGINKVDDKYLQKDLTKASFFTLSNDSKEFVKNLDTDITLHVLTDEATMDGTVKTFIKQYQSYGKQVKVKYHSQKTDEGVNFYRSYTDTQPTEGSIIVVAGNRSRVVDYNDLFVKESGFDSTTYQYTESISGIDIEGQITSAMAYVLSDAEYKIYFLKDHGEMDISEKTKEQLKKAGFTFDNYSMLKDGDIPADCTALVIAGPTSDLTKENVEKVKEYVKNGGSVVLFASLDTMDTPVYDTLFTDYGVKITDGMLFEMNANYTFQNYPYFIIPATIAHQITNSVYTKARPNLFYYPRGFVIDDSDVNNSAESLFETSEDCYQAQVSEEGEVVLEEGSSGYYTLAYYKEVISEDATGKITAFSSPYFLAEEPDMLTSYANTEVFTDALCYMCDMSLESAVPAKTYDQSFVLVPLNVVYFFFFLLVVGIPVLELAAGIVITIVRRKK